MTNQASEETLDSIRDRIIHAANNGYSESINDLDYYDKPLQALIRTEKLKLLAEVRERVIGENDRGTITDPDSPSYGEPYESTTADKEELRAELTKLEAEL